LAIGLFVVTSRTRIRLEVDYARFASRMRKLAVAEFACLEFGCG
jgi:hypothetical protein